MTVVGIDYYNTLTEGKKLYRQLFSALLQHGHKVYIISAVEYGGQNERMKIIKRDNFPVTKIFIVCTRKATDAPWKKYRLAKKLGVQIMIDDRGDICELFSRRGILALNAFRGLEYIKSTELIPLSRESRSGPIA